MLRKGDIVGYRIVLFLLVAAFLALNWGHGMAQSVTAILEQTITGDGIECSYKFDSSDKEIQIYCVISNVEIE